MILLLKCYHCCFRSMGRKFQLCQKKKHYPVTSLTISIPLDKVMVYKVSLPLGALPLRVSLPRSVYLSSPADCVETLRRRVDVTDILPRGQWNNSCIHLHTCMCVLSMVLLCWFTTSFHVGWNSVVQSENLVFYKLPFDLRPDVEFILCIQSDFSWQLHYCGVEVRVESCSLLADLPAVLCCARAIEQVITLLSSTKPCVGNSDDRFLALLSRRNGVFKDSTGMIPQVW